MAAKVNLWKSDVQSGSSRDFFSQPSCNLLQRREVGVKTSFNSRKSCMAYPDLFCRSTHSHVAAPLQNAPTEIFQQFHMAPFVVS